MNTMNSGLLVSFCGTVLTGDPAKPLRHGFAYFVGRDRALRPALVFRAFGIPGQVSGVNEY